MKKILMLSFFLVLVILLFSYLYFYVFDADNVSKKLADYNDEVAARIWQYKLANGKLPDTLSDVKVEDRGRVLVVIPVQTYYSSSQNTLDFRLVTRRTDSSNELFVLCIPNWSQQSNLDLKSPCKRLLAFPPNSTVTNTNWPVYGQGMLFNQKNLWPKIDGGVCQ